MIREFQKNDIDQVMQIWLESNIETHNFIAKEYWISNYSMVKESILQAEVCVYENEGVILGFIGVMDDYIAGVFVDKRYRSMGIGKQLLDCMKSRHDSLTLGVYQKNRRAVSFYLQEQFAIISEEVDEDTGEMDDTMLWKRTAD